jgi:hypothetical protein
MLTTRRIVIQHSLSTWWEWKWTLVYSPGNPRIFFSVPSPYPSITPTHTPLIISFSIFPLVFYFAFDSVMSTKGFASGCVCKSYCGFPKMRHKTPNFASSKSFGERTPSTKEPSHHQLSSSISLLFLPLHFEDPRSRKIWAVSLNLNSFLLSDSMQLD